jgi:hypothetical protein
MVVEILTEVKEEMKNIAHRFCPLSLTISFESLSGSMVNSEFSFCIVDPLKFYPPGSIHSTPDSSMRSVLANIQFPDFEATYEDRQEQTVKGPSHPNHDLLLQPYPYLKIRKIVLSQGITGPCLVGQFISTTIYFTLVFLLLTKCPTGLSINRKIFHFITKPLKFWK